MHQHLLSLVAVACALRAGEISSVQLLPAGEFAASDGRPGAGKKWSLSDAQGRLVAQAINARGNEFVIDYEHQTMLSADNGLPAPAAGWARSVEWRDGVGLFAVDVRWTERAQAMLAAGEYRYVSPVLVADKSGAVVDVLHAALVNVPGLDMLPPLTDALAARNDDPRRLHTRTAMDLLKRIVAALKLAAESTEDQALAAIDALSAAAARSTELETQVASLKSTAGAGNDAIKALQNEVATLRAATARREQDELIASALASGKLLPAQETWARTLTPEALKGYVESAPAIAALKGTQTGGKGEERNDVADAEALRQKAAKYIADQAALGFTVQPHVAVAHVKRAA
jgi:phage I-like protein